MGYNLTIGNACLEFQREDSYLTISAERVDLPNAPAFGEPTDNSNMRWPSYTSWGNVMREIGLYNLMDKENENCLIPEHPGHCVLNAEIKKEIDIAYDAFYKKYPNCKAGYSPKSTDFYEDPDWPSENSTAVRLEWLKFWVDWALENCVIPIFHNS